jgi:AcrR family transcriptional regulator
LAKAIGVRAASLYKRFPDRAGLLVAVERQALEALADTLSRAMRAVTPAGKLQAMAHAYRRFGRAHPRPYALLYSGATVVDLPACECVGRLICLLMTWLRHRRSAMLRPADRRRQYRVLQW